MALPGRVPLTVIVPTLNEAGQIGDCLATLAWADEVIVADGGSTDDTVSRARMAGATVLERTGPTIGAQRNAAIATARNHWLLAIDADERVPPTLAEELAAVLGAPAHRAYRIRRRNFYLGRELRRGHWGRDWVTRLFTRESRYVGRRVHEHLERVAECGVLHGTLDHFPYRDLGHQLEKMSRYARWGAEDLYQRGHRAGVADLVGRPLGRFLRAYLLQGSCRDGRFGLVTSILGGYTAFLKYAYLWERERPAPDAGGRGPNDPARGS